jgi:TRAP-type uncharacterized transport system fused permease subunit
MNFEDLKEEMDHAAQNEEGRLPEIDLSRGQNNPVQLIRSNMKKEIVVQLIAIVIFMTYPSINPLPEMAESAYYIFMFLISIMTLSYVIKLFFFLNKTSDLTRATKDTVRDFVYETRLTLEVYKSFVTAGSILLPIPVFALLSKFSRSGDQYVFEKWFLLDIPASYLVWTILAYLLTSILFYLITVLWTQSLYGKYLKSLDQIIKDLD